MSVTPYIVIIFGATGDLTHRKLMPALYHLYEHGNVNDDYSIVGFARREYTNDAFRDEMEENVNRYADGIREETWNNFRKLLTYQQGKFGDKKAYADLAKLIDKYDRNHNYRCNHLFYLATPPRYYGTILENLVKTGLAKERVSRNGEGWTKIVIEKPFGKDLMTARALDLKLSSSFAERQIHRIDHYLGKETVQNIIAFRFANGIFEPVWNKDYIDHVQITMAETLGMEGRGSFYEGVGALRDVMQNHILAMVSLTAMEQPQNFSAEGVRDARSRVIARLHCLESSQVDRNVVRGQYDHGVVGGHEVPGYRKEKGVDKDSMTETFVAMKLFIDSPRWQGVPWYLRTGKRLMRNTVEISLVFRQTCHILFREYGCPEKGNILTIKISPDEGIGVRFVTKEPGHAFSLKTVDMDFTYRDAFAHKEVVDAYERILEDAFKGDQMLFNRSDELEESWQFITKILTSWEKQKPPKFYIYAAGSWGPKEARELIERDGRKWIVH